MKIINIPIIMWLLIINISSMGGDIFEFCNVDINDSLNVRKSPSLNSEIIWKLPFNATDIIILNKKDNWCEISVNRKKGWVKDCYLSKSECLFAELVCFGNEPYWKIEFKNKIILFGNPDNKDMIYQILKIQRSENNSNTCFVNSKREDIHLSMFIIKDNCFDDMSDKQHVFRIFFFDELSGKSFNGCCNCK